MAEAKKSKKEVIAEAFPEGEVIKFKDRKEITMKQDVGDLRKGKKYKVHPNTAKQFAANGWC